MTDQRYRVMVVELDDVESRNGSGWRTATSGPGSTLGSPKDLEPSAKPSTRISRSGPCY